MPAAQFNNVIGDAHMQITSDNAKEYSDKAIGSQEGENEGASLANASQARDEFNADIAFHNLKNFAANTVMLSRLLMNDPNMSEEDRNEFVGDIMASSVRMLEVIQQLNENRNKDRDARERIQNVDTPTGKAAASVPTVLAVDSENVEAIEIDDDLTPLPVRNRVSSGAAILFVDDEPVNLQIFSRQARNFDYTVQTAQGGKAALELIARQTPDIIVLDLMMPEMDGYQVCTEIRKSHDLISLPIVILTAKNQVGNLIDAMNAGANDYLTKPFRIEELFARIETHLKVRENDKLRREKEEAEHMARATSEFLANMSHEIRTPLNAILGFTELLSDRITEGKERHFLEVIASSGNNLLTLINDILNLSKIQAGKLELQYESVNPRSIFSEIKNIFSIKTKEKGLDFQVSIAENVPEAIWVDSIRLRQILFNLVGNAVKFTDTGFIKVSLLRVGEYSERVVDLKIIVEDTGIGVPADHLDKIFEAFRQRSGQSTRKFGGSGLGLAITKRLVEMMNGAIEVDSVEGNGSMFTIYLRNLEVGSAIDTDSATPKSQIDRPVFASARVLLVDDVQINRDLIKEFLEYTNLTVFEASNGGEALDKVCYEKPDLIIMDLKMPKMTGEEATNILKGNPEFTDIPIIALTASVLKEAEERIRSAGFDGYLTKPVAKKDLYAELVNFLPLQHGDSQTTTSADMLKEDAPGIERLTEESQHRLRDVMPELEGMIASMCEEVKDSLIIGKVKSLANILIDLGKQTECQTLKSYGEALQNQATLLDIDQMTETLEKYTELLKSLHEIIHQHKNN